MLGRSGGWVVPLQCDNPLLAQWLTHLKVACSIVGVPCDTYVDPALGVCPKQWTPLTIILTACGLAAFCLLLLGLLCLQFVRWLRSRKCGTMSALAGAAAQKLQKANPTLYPAVQHSWCKLSDNQLRAPSLCAQCFDTLQPDTDGRRVQSCEVCGVLCHESCCRKMPHDCRPVAEVGGRILHLWKPAGCVLVEPEEDWRGEAGRCCLYCQERCEPDIFAQEPIWSCAWCQAVVHVRCYRDYHAACADPHCQANGSTQASGSTRANGSTLANGSIHTPRLKVEDGVSGKGDSFSGGQGNCTPGGKGGIAGKQGSLFEKGESISWMENGDSDRQLGGLDNPFNTATSQPHNQDRSPAEDGGKKLKKQLSLVVPSFDLGDGVSASPTRMMSGFEAARPSLSGRNESGVPAEAFSSPALQSPVVGGSEKQPIERRNGFGSFFGSISDCMAMPAVQGFGSDDEEEPLGRCPRILSPRELQEFDTCQIGPHRGLVLPPTAVTLLPTNSWSEKAKDFLRSSTKDKKLINGSSSKSLQLEAKGGTQRTAHWWGEAHVPWGSYQINRLPPGCKPLLVFINSKSGPQTGSILRRKLLRLLNPIQVVELPKEKPEDALHLWADVTNLQILVMGGDGTAGWILGCLDQIQEARLSLPIAQPWSPPPVAVIPMGTGNDLARCLGWGGGLHSIMLKGMGSLLRDIELNAIVSLLDRWTVRIQPLTNPSSSKPKIQLMGKLSQPEPPQEVRKAMNNYLGIGVDAKASLDFHALREIYPKWFRSQMGNKLWYTTVGAKDILGHTSRGLSKNIQVECDGEVLHLPEDIEGLLVLNINSYMGGVDLWSSGTSTQFSHSSPAKQSMCDGQLEVVAVYGSWHLGQLQVGLSAAIRLTQCRKVKIICTKETPVQVDGEPWMQPPATLEVTLKMKALMLRKTESAPLSRFSKAVAEALEDSVTNGVITATQRRSLTEEIATKLNLVS